VGMYVWMDVCVCRCVCVCGFVFVRVCSRGLLSGHSGMSGYVR
jgi:hypothetical protein